MRAAIWRSPSAARGQPRRSRRRARPFAKITMRAVGATGWTVSSIGPVHRYGGALEIGSKTSIRKTRFFYAQSLRSEISPKQWIPTERSPPWRSGNNHGFCVTGGPPPIAAEPTPSPRLWATPPGATPAGLCEHTMGADCQPSKPGLSTWPGIGTFYLAPTGALPSDLLAYTQADEQRRRSDGNDRPQRGCAEGVGKPQGRDRR